MNPDAQIQSTSDIARVESEVQDVNPDVEKSGYTNSDREEKTESKTADINHYLTLEGLFKKRFRFIQEDFL